MAKLYSADIGKNSSCITTIQNDVNDANKLKNALNNFIIESQRDSGNGKILDGEIWNIVRDNFQKCIDANEIRIKKSTRLVEAINKATQQLNQYMRCAPQPFDPADNSEIAVYEAKLRKAEEDYNYWSTHEIVIDQYWNEATQETVYIYGLNTAMIDYCKMLILKYKAILEWLKKLEPTDNEASSLVGNINLDKIKIN